MRRVVVVLSLTCVVAAVVVACGETGDSKLKNGQDLPPGNLFDGAADPPDSGTGTGDTDSGDVDSGAVKDSAAGG